MGDLRPTRWKILRQWNGWAWNRPHFQADAWDDGGYVGLSYGNRNSDAAWSIGVQFPLPGWAHRWLVRRWDRRHADG